LQDAGKTIHSQLMSLEDPENESVSVIDIGNAMSQFLTQ
jgi:gluconate kinase